MCTTADVEYIEGPNVPPEPQPPLPPATKCVDEFGNPILCDRVIVPGPGPAPAPVIGNLQSPINLDQFAGMPVAPNVQAFNYGNVHTWDYHNEGGKAVWVIRHFNWPWKPFLNVNGVHYILWQFHCHNGPEHTVRGMGMNPYFECHFVHVARFPVHSETPTVTAVLGVYLEKPHPHNPVNPLPATINFAPGALVPCNPWKYTYWGSLTANKNNPPPFPEGVAWMVPSFNFKFVDAWSRDLFYTGSHGVRGLQLRNGREVRMIP